jgi:hypothetical protein
LGSTFQYLVVSNAGGTATSPPDGPYQIVRQDLGHWTAFLLQGAIVELTDLDRTTATLSEHTRLAVGLYVEFSDWGYCVGASDGDVAFRIVVNDSLAELGPTGRWALEQCAALAHSPAWKLDAATRVQRWAAQVPYESTVQEVAAEDVLVVLNEGAVFADDALDRFTRMLGIPSVRWPMEQPWPY